MCVGSVTQSCPTLCDATDCNPPGSSGPGDFSSKTTTVSCHFLLQGIFPTQGLNPYRLCLLHCSQILYQLSHQGSHKRAYITFIEKYMCLDMHRKSPRKQLQTVVPKTGVLICIKYKFALNTILH